MTLLSWNVFVIDDDERSYLAVVVADSCRQVIAQLRTLDFRPEAPSMDRWRVIQISERPPLG